MIEIAGRKIGLEYPPYWIADIGANHDGDLDRAIHLVTLAAGSGADAVKFQNFSAPKIVSRRGFQELGKVAHQADWEGSVYEEYEKASVPLDWTPTLAMACQNCGVAYLTTPYDLEVVDAIDPYVPAWKIGSGDITYRDLLRHVGTKGKPVILGTGASTGEEVWRAMKEIWRADPDVDIVILHCNTNYTGDAKNLCYSNLSILYEWNRDRQGFDIGLSDHTCGPIAPCVATALGACVIEKHLTDDCSRPGPDHAFALTPDEFRVEVNTTRMTHLALGDGVKKVEENEAQVVQRRALRYAAYMPDSGELASRGFVPAGFIVRKFDIVATRPCPEGALEPYRIDEVVDRRLKRDVEVDTLVRLEDFE